MNDTIKTVFENLSEVFRHILPGAVVGALALLSDSQWASEITSEKNGLWIFIATTIVIGNLIYVIHRALVHQLVDYVVWRLSPGVHDSYSKRVAHMIKHHFGLDESARKSIHLKNSQIILTAITGELIVIVSPKTECPLGVGAFGLALFAGACIAHYVSQQSVLELEKL